MAPQAETNTTETEIDDFNNDSSVKFGKLLTSPDLGEEIVISGLAGQYPDSNEVHHFRDNLYNKIDMISDDDRRWERNHPEVPNRTGKVPNIEKFDAGYFGVHSRQATHMDPMMRLLFERVMEALFDAGINPSDLEGTNTGVFIGACSSETERTWFHHNLIPQGYAVTGCSRSMQANRISYYLKLKGPSIVCDTACSSSLFAVEHAYKALRTGQCDRAIVGGTNICLNMFYQLQFVRLGVLSMDGICKVFDNAGNGYVRSETISAIILQKSKEAKRIYSTILHTKSNCDGYKDSGITYPSGDMQIRLYKEIYEECREIAKPTDLSFLEAHGTGTKVGDPEELQAVEDFFLKGRKTPLLVGSVKSNIGHTEPSSGLCSITKVILAYETGYIPPNLHYSTPRDGIKSLEDGRLKVVTDKMPFNDNRGIIGINNFGFGGANCHVLLKHNPRQKLNRGRPKDNIPRLVCVSGRTREAVDSLLDDVFERNDLEHIRLLQDVFRKNVAGHLYRGYSAMTKSKEISRSCTLNAGTASPLVLCFGPIDEGIIKETKEFLELPCVAKTVQRIQEVLLPKGSDIFEIVSKPQQTVLETVLANFTYQIVFADLFKALDIVPDKIFGLNKGFSLGTLICAYFDDALSLRKAVECAYAVAEAANTTVDVNGGMRNSMDLADLFGKNTKAGIQLQQALEVILPKALKLSKKVIFEVTPSEISAVNLVNGFDSIKIFSALRRKSVVFEVGNGYINEVLKKALPRMKEKSFIGIGAGLNSFIISIGRLYELGYNPQIQNLFPKVAFPVSRGTPMISPKIKWLHDKKWYVTRTKSLDLKTEERHFRIVLNNNSEFLYVGGHVIDGRVLFPATGYLQIVWETLAYVHGLQVPTMNIVFENCKFKRACAVPKDGVYLELIVMIQIISGNFEVIEGGEPVVTGKLILSENNETDLATIPLPTQVTQAASMSTKDIYKELRLRGYNYKGQFKGLKSCDVNAQVGEITWDGNWVTFVDNMLQMKILQEDTRLLYVPTTIQRITVNAKAHGEYADGFKTENPNLPVYISKSADLIRSGFIEIRGLNASSIARRKYWGTPVLEKYVFVPNVAKLKTEQAIRVNMQILLENFYSIKVKAVELIEDEASEGLQALAEIIHDVLADQPLIQPNIISCKVAPEGKQIKVKDENVLQQDDYSLVVGSKVLQRKDLLNFMVGLLKENGFILSREPIDFDASSCPDEGINIITTFTTEDEKLIFFRKNEEFRTTTVVKVSSEDNQFTWLPVLKRAVERDTAVLVLSQAEPLNGALGLVACIRRETGGQNVKLVFTPDRSAPEFDFELPFYQEQLKKNLAINVSKNGQWGTYRHLLLEEGNQIGVAHCYLNTLIRGDLSSLNWIEGPLKFNTPLPPENPLISVYYAALNFRDIMTASGRINVDVITRNRREQECVQGFEFSGRTQSGKRIMGMITNGACASLVKADKDLLWDVPDDWSLADAATVTVVYGTCMYSLFLKGKMRQGNTVLIHSGAGGIGQAGITLALHVGCTVYTTVGSPEKREYLKKKFPQLTDKNIANSRDTSFEKHIMTMTNGRGVDIVLNSLAEEKLLASVRCLARGGRFLEIGKFDLASNNTLNLHLVEREASFHGIMLDALIYDDYVLKFELHNLVQQGINNGIIKPLSRTVFNMNQQEEAFRYMTSGKHMGKVLLQIRSEEKEKFTKPTQLTFPAVPRYYCDIDKSYVICGGLGGFGLELADWLVLRGCQKLILSSRSGIKTGYQTYRISILKSYGCTVNISTEDITTKDGCQNLITEATKLGPVHAIFNLAVVLKDAVLENQTEESFKISFGPKAYATEYLDAVSRKLCPELRDFVIFSSVSCGRGNSGQTNYGMANSVMERICEKRRNEGLPALAIEWGAVGDVGLVAELLDDAIEMAIGGTLQQRISNCLQCMDTFLTQSEASVVSSIVVAEKRGGAGQFDNIVDAVAAILGIKDLKSISMQATLAEVGMDSMTALEIKQTLEREFEVFLTAQDIKSMTFARLIEIQAEKDADSQSGKKKENALIGMDMIYRSMAEASIVNIPVMLPNGKISDKPSPSLSRLLFFPGIEGVATTLEPLYKHLEAELVVLQYPNDTQKDTIEEMANTYLPLIEERISKSEPFKIICYSYGGIIALEAAFQLEQKGYKGTIICIDSSPDYLKGVAQILDVGTENMFQMSLVVQMMSLQTSYDVIASHMEALSKCEDLEARIKMSQTILGPNQQHSPEHTRACAISFYKRLKALVKWSPEFKLKSKVVLLKPKLVSINIPEEDYGLSKICEDPVEVGIFDGNHVTILENPEVPLEINRYLGLVENE